MGSADMMTRNLTRRVEVVTPVDDESLQKELQVGNISYHFMPSFVCSVLVICLFPICHNSNLCVS